MVEVNREGLILAYNSDVIKDKTRYIKLHHMYDVPLFDQVY